jgi:curved DNA-binding protein CbpA
MGPSPRGNSLGNGGYMKNYYEILEINENASFEVIEKVYRVLAKKYHPDLNNENYKEESEKKFKEIVEAYDVLSNQKKKAEYDRKLSSSKRLNDNKNYQQYKAYNDLYLRALKNLKIRNIYPATLEDFFIDLFTFIFIIIFLIILYQVPMSRKFIRETMLNF